MDNISRLIKKCVDQIIQHNPVIKNIFQKIYDHNGKVLLVGGIVRDSLLKKSGSDLDFEIYHISFDKLQEILSEFGPVSFVGKSFGVLRLHSIDADWSIPRKDSSGRKPIVQLDPNMSFKEAFKRRDLTINSMGINVQTLELIDPFNGQKDLKSKILRATDQDFFIQDPLRLFRVMQFSARLNMKPDNELNNICKKIDISSISKERIYEEFKKLFLKSENPSLGLSWLFKIEQFEKLFPEIEFNTKLTKAIDCFSKQKTNTLNLKLSGMWAIIACNLKNIDFDSISVENISTKNNLKPIKEFLQKHVISSEIIDCATDITWYVHYIPLIIKEEKLSNYKWLAFWIQKSCNLKNLALIGNCLYKKIQIDVFIKNSKEYNVFYEYEKPLLQGKDLLQISSGKNLGALLKQAYKLQINLDIKEKEKLLKILLDKNL